MEINIKKYKWIRIMGVIIILSSALIFGGVKWYESYKYNKHIEYFQEGIRQTLRGNYKLSNEILFNALSYKETDSIHIQIAHNYNKLSEYDEAIVHYSKSLSLLSRYENPFPLYFLRGECYYKTKEYRLALDDFNSVISMLLRWADSKWEYREMKAIRTLDIQEALGSEKINFSRYNGYEMLSNAILYKAIILDIQEEKDKAIKLLKHSLFIDPDNIDVLQLLEKSDNLSNAERKIFEINKETKTSLIRYKDLIYEEVQFRN